MWAPLTSSRARPPLVKGVGHIGPLFPEFRGWPLWFMASIALRGPHQRAPEVVPGASLHSEALTPECGRECLETVSHVGAGRSGLLGLTAYGLLGRRHLGPCLSHIVGEVGAGSIEIPAFLGWGVRAVPRFPRVWSFGALYRHFFSTSLNKKKRIKWKKIEHLEFFLWNLNLGNISTRILNASII